MNRTHPRTRITQTHQPVGMFGLSLPASALLLGWSLLVVIGLMLPIPGVVAYLIWPLALGAAAAGVWLALSRRTATSPTPEQD